jgi:L-glyceraldehyde 3-phosphate reductase
MLASLDQSLKRMNLDYVDIFYHHRMDFETPLEESMMALDTAVKSGRALYAGISNYDSKHTAKAMEILKELKCPFIINQVSYSIFNRFIEEDGLKSFAAKNGCGIIAFSPLAQGMLTDRYLEGTPEDSRIKKSGVFLKNSDLTPKRIQQIQQLNNIAKVRGQSLAQMALAWVLRDGEVTSVLIGASKPRQILDNLEGIKNIGFSQDELEEIDKIVTNERQ